jgi:threonine dehydrogenase-like Zn-dependent dehydrogenase
LLPGGRGPDAVIDAVGMEAHGYDERVASKAASFAQRATGLLPDRVAQKITDVAAVDRLDALHTAVKAVRRGGTVSVSGVYGGEVDPMPMMEMFDRGIQLRMGQAHVKRWIDDLLPLVADSADPLGVRDFATHHLPLEEAPQGYEMFRDKADGCIKVVLQPGK